MEVIVFLTAIAMISLCVIASMISLCVIAALQYLALYILYVRHQQCRRLSSRGRGSEGSSSS